MAIEWDTMQQDKHAIDFITTFNRTVADANPCLGVANCGAAPPLFPFPWTPPPVGSRFPAS